MLSQDSEVWERREGEKKGEKRREGERRGTRTRLSFTNEYALQRGLGIPKMPFQKQTWPTLQEGLACSFFSSINEDKMVFSK